MKILLAGPVEGHLTRLFDAAESSETSWVVSCGDFGAFPDPARMDRASRQYGASEFASYYVGATPRPIRVPVLFIAGVHEDHRFLRERYAVQNTEVLSNVHWLANGFRTTIGADLDQPPLRVTGLGRAYSEVTYSEQYTKRSRRHYTRHDVERACSSGPTDLLVLHEHLDAPGLRHVIFATRPKLILTASHPNRKTYREVQKTPVITLGRGQTHAVYWEDGCFV